MTEAYEKYRELLKKLEAIRANQISGVEDPEENKILDAMDPLWFEMTWEERQKLNKHNA